MTSRIELTVDMIADSIATRNSEPSSGGITVDAMMLEAWSGDGRNGNRPRMPMPSIITQAPMTTCSSIEMPMA